MEVMKAMQISTKFHIHSWKNFVEAFLMNAYWKPVGHLPRFNFHHSAQLSMEVVEAACDSMEASFRT